MKQYLIARCFMAGTAFGRASYLQNSHALSPPLLGLLREHSTLQSPEFSSKGASPESEVDNLQSHFSKHTWLSSSLQTKGNYYSCRKKCEARGEYLHGTFFASVRKMLPLNTVVSRSVDPGMSLKTRPAHTIWVHRLLNQVIFWLYWLAS